MSEPDANRTASSEDAPSPFVVGLLAWLIPGAGHFYLGYTVKAGVFFVGILGLVLFGSALGDWRIIAFPDGKTSDSPTADNLWFLVQLGSGLSTILFGIINQGQPAVAGINQPLEIAHLYCRVAGMLNILLVIDAFSRAEAMGMPAQLRLPVQAPRTDAVAPTGEPSAATSTITASVTAPGAPPSAAPVAAVSTTAAPRPTVRRGGVL